jgi:hypothetical protein
MLCLHDSIRHNDPAVQRLLSAVEDAHTLSALILAAWQVARVLTVTSSKPCWPNVPGTRRYGPAARCMGRACTGKALRSAR